MKTEIIAIVLLFSLIFALIGCELITIKKLDRLEARLSEGCEPRELYEAFCQEENFFLFIFSREEIRELELAFFEYTLTAEENEKHRLAEEISHTRRQLLLF